MQRLLFGGVTGHANTALRQISIKAKTKITANIGTYDSKLYTTPLPH